MPLRGGNMGPIVQNMYTGGVYGQNMYAFCQKGPMWKQSYGFMEYYTRGEKVPLLPPVPHIAG